MEGLPDGELIDLLARHDNAEWQPEVFGIAEEILRQRGVKVDKAVATARAAFAREPAPDVDVTLVTVARFFTPIEAQLCHAHLAQGGLSPIIADENLAAIHFGLGVAAGA